MMVGFRTHQSWSMWWWWTQYLVWKAGRWGQSLTWRGKMQTLDSSHWCSRDWKDGRGTREMKRRKNYLNMLELWHVVVYSSVYFFCSYSASSQEDTLLWHELLNSWQTTKWDLNRDKEECAQPAGGEGIQSLHANSVLLVTCQWSHYYQCLAASILFQLWWQRRSLVPTAGMYGALL